MVAQTNPEVSVKELQALIAEHPQEFRRMLDEVESVMYDKYGRVVRVTDKVVTPANENGMVIRVDKKSKRVLVQLENGKTRMLMSHRVCVKRGRPRKADVA